MKRANAPFPWVARHHPRNQILHLNGLLSKPIQPLERNLALQDVHLALVPSTEGMLSAREDVVEDASQREDVDRPRQPHARVRRRRACRSSARAREGVDAVGRMRRRARVVGVDLTA